MPPRLLVEQTQSVVTLAQDKVKSDNYKVLPAATVMRVPGNENSAAYMLPDSNSKGNYYSMYNSYITIIYFAFHIVVMCSLNKVGYLT